MAQAKVESGATGTPHYAAGGGGPLAGYQRANLFAALEGLRELLAWRNVLLSLWPSLLLIVLMWAWAVAGAIRLKMLDSSDFDPSLLFSQAFPAIALTVFTLLVAVSISRTDRRRIELYLEPCRQNLRRTDVVANLADGGSALSSIYSQANPFERLFLGGRPGSARGWAVLAARNLAWYLESPGPVFRPAWVGQIILTAVQALVLANILLATLPAYLSNPGVVRMLASIYAYTGKASLAEVILPLFLGSTIFATDFRTTPIHAAALMALIEERLASSSQE